MKPKEQPRSSAPSATRPAGPPPASLPRQPKSSDGPAGGGEEEGSGGTTAAAVAVSAVLVVLLAGAAAFVVLRTRLAPRLRARLTRTPYEDIVIGRPPARSESQQNVIA